MIKSLIVGLSCLIIFTSFTEVVAQEEISILLGKNVKEWHAIGIALISEKKHEEAIKYYDKILEINPEDQKALLNKGSVLKDLERYEESIKYYDRILEINPDHVKALASKGLSLEFLLQWAEAEELIFRAVELEPDNKQIQGIKYQFLEGVPTISERDSVYEIKLRVTVRDSSGNLVSISESSNSRYLPYPITDKIFERYIIDEGVMIDGKAYDIAQNVDSYVPDDNASGAFTISTTKYGHVLNVFFSFVPMIFLETDDKVIAEWTIIKEIT
jgi:tetratricopeptide (TPR) repeat protein